MEHGASSADLGTKPNVIGQQMRVAVSSSTIVELELAGPGIVLGRF
jgi:hypothetical protein